MAHSGQKIEVVPPAEEPEEIPLPSDPKAIFLGGLFFLALLAAAYVASKVVLPLVFAIVLTLLLQPALRLLERLRLPRTIASLPLILALLGTIVGLGTAVSGPARSGHPSEARTCSLSAISRHSLSAVSNQYRNTAAATAQVYNPATSPSAAAVIDRLSMISWVCEPRDLADRGWHAGPQYQNVAALFEQARERLKPGGCLYVMLSSGAPSGYANIKI
jgi:hypothetical protein